MLFQRRRRIRHGIAATEMALLSPVVLILLVGIWEVGRLIHVRNVLEYVAREGSRMAASGGYFASDNHGNPSGGTLTLIPPSTNDDYEVQKKVLVSLQAAGLSTTGVTVTVSNQGTASSPKNWSYTWTDPGSGSGSGYDPSAAADQLDTIRVNVTLPYANVGWSALHWFVSSGAVMSATAYWESMRDYPLVVSTTIPPRPLTSADPLP